MSVATVLELDQMCSSQCRDHFRSNLLHSLWIPSMSIFATFFVKKYLFY